VAPGLPGLAVPAAAARGEVPAAQVGVELAPGVHPTQGGVAGSNGTDTGGASSAVIPGTPTDVPAEVSADGGTALTESGPSESREQAAPSTGGFVVPQPGMLAVSAGPGRPTAVSGDPSGTRTADSSGSAASAGAVLVAAGGTMHSAAGTSGMSATAADPANAVRAAGAPASGAGSQTEPAQPQAAPAVPLTPAPTAPPAVTGPAAPQPAATPAQPTPLAGQLTGPLQTLVDAGAGEHVLTVRVTPDDLGPVTVRAHIGTDGVRIELFAPNDAGREAVRAVLTDLRRDLAGAGTSTSLELSSQDRPGQQDSSGRGSSDRTDARREPASEPSAPTRGLTAAGSAPVRSAGLDVLA